MTAIRAPRSIDAATRLLEEFATIEGDIAEIEANRAHCIADVNARCDTATNPLLEKREKLRAVLQPWWEANAAELTQGKRKSIELGGCNIGSKAGRTRLIVHGTEDDVVALMAGLRWAKPFLRIKTTLDRMALLKGLDGKHSLAIAELGIRREEGEDVFVLERAEQAGTRAGTSA